MTSKSAPVLFAYCLDILLYGILTVQIYIYYLSFPNDRRMTKATAAFVYIIATLQTAFALHDFHALFCTQNSLPDLFPDYLLSLRRFGFMWITIPLSGASVFGETVAVVSQLFYAHRIRILSRKKLVPGVITVLALLHLVVGIFIAFVTYKDQSIVKEVLYPSSFFDAFAWELSGAICDLVITIYMFRFLSKHIERSFRPTRLSLTRIKRLTLETGLVTTTVAIAYTILTCPAHSAAFIIPGLALSKIYGNSVLALLNNRLSISGGRNEIDSDCVVDHFATAEHQLESLEQRNDFEDSVSLSTQPNLEHQVYHSRK